MVVKLFCQIYRTYYQYFNTSLVKQESWPYLSNATPWPYELSHVKNEFSLVGLTACNKYKVSNLISRYPF